MDLYEATMQVHLRYHRSPWHVAQLAELRPLTEESYILTITKNANGFSLQNGERFEIQFLDDSQDSVQAKVSDRIFTDVYEEIRAIRCS